MLRVPEELVVLTPYNYDYVANLQVVDTGQSMTVPDQSLTIAQIIERFTKGLTVPGAAPVNIDADMSDYQNLNDFERIDMKRQLSKRVDELKELHDREKAEKAAARTKKSIDDEVARRVKESGHTDVPKTDTK